MNDLLKRLQIYKKEAVYFVFLTGVLLMTYFLILKTSNETVFRHESQWREARIQLEKALRQKKVERDLNQFVNLLEDQEHYADVIKTPNVIANKYRLNVPSVTYQKEMVDRDFLRVSFAFSVTGTYEAIRQFISEIETSKSLYIIEDMNLGKSSKEGNLLELQLKMSTLLKTKA